MKTLALIIGLTFSTLAFGWTEITQENLVKETKTNGIIVLHADWCGYCQAYMPILNALEDAYPSLKFMSIDIDDQPELGSRYAPEGIPVTYFVWDGKVVSQITGGGTKEQVKTTLDQFLNFLEKQK